MLIHEGNQKIYNVDVSCRIPSAFSSMSSILSEKTEEPKNIALITKKNDKPIFSIKNKNESILKKKVSDLKNDDSNKHLDNELESNCPQQVSFVYKGDTMPTNKLDLSLDEMPTPVAYVKFPWIKNKSWTRLLPLPEENSCSDMYCCHKNPAAKFLKYFTVDRIMKRDTLSCKSIEWEYSLRVIFPSGQEDFTQQPSPIPEKEIDVANSRFPTRAIRHFTRSTKSGCVWSLKNSDRKLDPEKVIYFETKFEDLPFEEDIFYRNWETRLSRLIESNISIEKLTIVYDFKTNYSSFYYDRWDSSCMKYLIHLAVMTHNAVKKKVLSIGLQILLLTPPSFNNVMKLAEKVKTNASDSYQLSIMYTLTQLVHCVTSTDICCGVDQTELKSEPVIDGKEDVEYSPTMHSGNFKSSNNRKTSLQKSIKLPGQILYNKNVISEQYIPAPAKASVSFEGRTLK